jgi:dihydrofolate reductase
VVEKVRTLKKEPGGDLLLSGSAQLFNMLKHEDVIDRYRLMVIPLILGTGRRLFAEGGEQRVLKLAHTQTFSSGIVVLEYEPVPQP